MLNIGKKIIKQIDHKLFHDTIKRKWTNYKSSHGERVYDFLSIFHRRFVNGKPLRILAKRNLSVRDLILAQYYHNNFSNYMQYDIALRVLALEEYFGNAQNGFNLYQKMQSGSGFNWKSRYKNLIQSYSSNGFNKANPIEVDHDFNIMDGAHRLALAYYHKQEFIDVNIYNGDRKRVFDMDFFWSNGFTPDECNLVKNKTQQILKTSLYPFVGVIWPSAYDIRNEILADLIHYDATNIKIDNIRDINLNGVDEFSHLIKALYFTDILDEKGCEKKIKLIKNSMNSEQYNVCIFDLHVNYPQMSVNQKNFQSQSNLVKKLKSTFRKRFENKVKNYNYDVILHVTDNYLQSLFCTELYKINQDLNKFFERIKYIPYYVIRAKASRQHPDFPNKFYFKSNSDIVTISEKYLNEIYNIALNFSYEHFCSLPYKTEQNSVNKKSNDSFELIKIKSVSEKDYKKVQIFLMDFMIFQFEILLHINGIKDTFRNECIEHRIFDKYYYLPDDDEIIIRLVEYYNNPHKSWYKNYLLSHLAELNKERLFLNLNDKTLSKNKLERFIKKLKE
ncbi:hypothetical protein [Succinivibrio dextrinosolvens]|uniref:Uncharacterized protein n=1 Tax=Succinivibrio dextrinosolvens TaxID=83771 RepID=A0A662ZCH8_9GAMM|nr:hypothetical protein [Succinivibrio dextrinosolvens]SFK44968.1 hypothetical protein SAMN04487865_10785 [Succinivibrio dextrinosolvens]